MANEIKRNYWSRFFKKFNSANQYRRARLSILQSGSQADPIPMGPFMGLTIRRKGRLIDGVQFLTGGWNDNSVVEPVMTISKPLTIWLEKDKDGCDLHLRVKSGDGTEACLDLEGERQAEQERHLVEKVAYSMYESRGHDHGNDLGDWLEAERWVRQTESELTG
jgi:hypothetical protein